MFGRYHNIAFVVIVCVLIAAAAYLFFASKAFSEAFPESPHVTLSDTYARGIHTIHGMVPVPSSCSDVLVSPDIRADTLVLFFVPRPKNELTGVCSPDTVDVPFSTSLEGPAVAYYLADIAGSIYPVHTQ